MFACRSRSCRTASSSIRPASSSSRISTMPKLRGCGRATSMHAAALNWREVALEGGSSSDFGEQLRGLDPIPRRRLAGQVQREDRQPDVRSPVGRRDLSQGPLVLARQRDSEARASRRQLRSRGRLAAVARAHERGVQGQEGARAAGPQPGSGGAAAGRAIVRQRSGARDGERRSGPTRSRSR